MTTNTTAPPSIRTLEEYTTAVLFVAEQMDNPAVDRAMAMKMMGDIEAFERDIIGRPMMLGWGRYR